MNSNQQIPDHTYVANGTNSTVFYARDNGNCTDARRRKDSKTQRKKIVRKMKHFARRMARHARTHRELLQKHRATKTDLRSRQAAQIIGRIGHVPALLPRAISQTHERIIGERRVPNKEKISSIYEISTKVIVLGKSGAEVEYGNPLLPGENRDGLIVHWELFEDNCSDSKFLEKALPATGKTIGAKLKKIVTDRGFSDEKFQAKLTEEYPQPTDHICPRSLTKLAEKKNDPEFRKSQSPQGTLVPGSHQNRSIQNPARGNEPKTGPYTQPSR
jgi:hypothetical protein